MVAFPIRWQSLFLQLLLLLSCASWSEAVKGGKRHLRKGELVETKERRLEIKKWGGVKGGTDLEKDDPDRTAARGGRKGGNSGNDGAKGVKVSKGIFREKGSKENSSNRIIECDDPSDPDCQITGNPQDFSGTLQDFNETPGLNPLEISASFQRDISSFKIAYSLSQPLLKDIGDGEYNELSDATVLHLTRYLTELFDEEDLIDFREVDVTMQRTFSPLTVRCFVRVNFNIPGDVPTEKILFDRINTAFSGNEGVNYVEILQVMGSQNPFRHTKSIEVIHEVQGEINDDEIQDSLEKSPFFTERVRLLVATIGAALLAAAIVGIMWVHKRARRKNSELTQPLKGKPQTLPSDDGPDSPTAKYSTRAYGDDEDTIQYLQEVRKRYQGKAQKVKPKQTSRTGNEVVDEAVASLEEIDQAERNESKSNKKQPNKAFSTGSISSQVDKELNVDMSKDADGLQPLTEKKEDLHIFDSASSVHENYGNNLTYASPPSVSTAGSSEQPFDEPKKKDFLKYLDFQSSFDDDDLRT